MISTTAQVLARYFRKKSCRDSDLAFWLERLEAWRHRRRLKLPNAQIPTLDGVEMCGAYHSSKMSITGQNAGLHLGYTPGPR